MKTICKEDINDFLSYISKNIYSNTYIIGNYYRYGIDNENIQFYISVGEIRYVLMKYFKDYVFYTSTLLHRDDLQKVADKINSSNYRVITGNEFSISQILSFVTHKNVRNTQLMSFERRSINEYSINSNIKKLDISHKNQLLNLYRSIHEFHDKYKGSSGEDRLTKTLIFDIVYGYTLEDSIIGAVSVTSNSGKSCMLTDICVSLKHRNKGISKKMINHVIAELNNAGTKYINLYVDNVVALNIYKKLGFIYIEDYLAVYKG